MPEEPTQKPKIIVDDNWKERVEAEREALRKQEAEPQSGTEEQAGPQAGAGEELPPPSFTLLVTSLATQALAALGQIPDPEQQKPVMRLDVAKHHIDTLGILEEKTKGNLSPEESATLSNVVHELRMMFVAVSGGAQGSEQGA